MERLDRWAISRSNLTILYNQKLGAGAFSNVFKGKLSGMAPVCEINPSIEASRTYSDCEVAVKILPTYASKSEKADFIREMNVMKSFNYHPHMICLLGTVSENIEDCLVMECCARGDLLHLIRDRSKKIINGDGDSSELQVKDLMCYAWQISDGMDYLCSKGFVHRDLAARNILIDHKNTAKIGDFGLCRTIDQSLYTIGGGRLPIKWMSIESLKFCICTPKSDVWSYGVLLFELFSQGEVPYSSVNMANMIEHLDAGHRLDQPKDCPNEIYTIMLNCWKVDPSTRPSFEDIRTEVSKQLESVTDSYGYLPVSDMQKKQKNRVCRSASDYDSVSETDSSVEDDHEQPTVLSLTPIGEVTV
uniref:Protein kinase domain-containing protein n=1 Tax=Plectus sambesii TaxID=2011161 RepID=A0A914VLN4_9BILA